MSDIFDLLKPPGQFRDIEDAERWCNQLYQLIRKGLGDLDLGDHDLTVGGSVTIGDTEIGEDADADIQINDDGDITTGGTINVTHIEIEGVAGATDTDPGVITDSDITDGVFTSITKTEGVDDSDSGIVYDQTTVEGVVTVTNKQAGASDATYNVFNHGVSGIVESITVTNGVVSAITNASSANIELWVIIPVTMTQTGGNAGDEDNECDYTYTLTNAITSAQIDTAVDPTAGTHKFVRHGPGTCSAATYGLGFWADAQTFTLTWCNEKLETEKC